MSASPLQTDIPTTTLGGRYRLVQRIGAGGMGTVWEAEDEVLKRPVAVKVLSPALCGNESVAVRFEREAQAAGRLTHPSIAQVFDYGRDDGCPYIVLERVAGSTLRAMSERRGPLPPGEVAEIGAQIAEALAAAHIEGIVHRDVKPGNVMVAPDGRVKVLDFGIADAAWFEPLTDTGTIIATARYISPEQATDRGATGASDVYSLGVVLYELFAGRLPFDGDSPIALAHAHAYEIPAPLSSAAPAVPQALRDPVEAAMRKDPAERPTAAELAAALRAGAAATTASTLAIPPAAPARTEVLHAGPALVARERSATALRSSGYATWSSNRGAIWLLAALAALVLVLGVGFAFAQRADRTPVRSGLDTPAASVAASPTTITPHDPGPRGKAVGHDAHGGGHGGEGPNEGRGGD